MVVPFKLMIVEVFHIEQIRLCFMFLKSTNYCKRYQKRLQTVEYWMLGWRRWCTSARLMGLEDYGVGYASS